MSLRIDGPSPDRYHWLANADILLRDFKLYIRLACERLQTSAKTHLSFDVPRWKLKPKRNLFRLLFAYRILLLNSTLIQFIPEYAIQCFTSAFACGGTVLVFYRTDLSRQRYSSIRFFELFPFRKLLQLWFQSHS